MKLKLVINGSDMRARIEPETSADKKILEFIAQMEMAEVVVEKKTDPYYSNSKEIKNIDLKFKPNIEIPDADGNIAHKIVDYPVAS
jgi:hypothetical protein